MAPSTQDEYYENGNNFRGNPDFLGTMKNKLNQISRKKTTPP